MSVIAAEAGSQSKTQGGSSGLFVKFLVGLVTAFALLSPIWVLTHGMGFLNQPPPPYWKMNAGTPAAASSSGHSGPASFGGC